MDFQSKSDPDTEFSRNNNGKRPPYHERGQPRYYNGDNGNMNMMRNNMNIPPRMKQTRNNGHNSGDQLFSASSNNLRSQHHNTRPLVPPNLTKDLYSQSSGNLKDQHQHQHNKRDKRSNKQPKSSTVDLLKSLKKKKRKQKEANKSQRHPTQPPLTHHRNQQSPNRMAPGLHQQHPQHPQQNNNNGTPTHSQSGSPMKARMNLNAAPFQPAPGPNSHDVGLNLNPANFTVNNLGGNIVNNNISPINNIGFTPFGPNNGPTNNPLISQQGHQGAPNNALGTSIFRQPQPNPYSLQNQGANQGPQGVFGVNNPYSLQNQQQIDPHKFNPNSKEFVPTLGGMPVPHPHSGQGQAQQINPKKSKLNANAVEFTLCPTPTASPTKMNDDHNPFKPKSQFKIPKPQERFMNNDIKNFDIRNFGPLIADKDVLNRDNVEEIGYDFGAALDESHTIIHGESRPNKPVVLD